MASAWRKFDLYLAMASRFGEFDFALALFLFVLLYSNSRLYADDDLGLL